MRNKHGYTFSYCYFYYNKLLFLCNESRCPVNILHVPLRWPQQNMFTHEWTTLSELTNFESIYKWVAGQTYINVEYLNTAGQDENVQQKFSVLDPFGLHRRNSNCRYLFCVLSELIMQSGCTFCSSCSIFFSSNLCCCRIDLTLNIKLQTGYVNSGKYDFFFDNFKNLFQIHYQRRKFNLKNLSLKISLSLCLQFENLSFKE